VARALCEYYAITEGKITVALDCEGAINAISTDQLPKAKNKEFDLIMECRNLMAQLPITIRYKWIEGHQDSKGKRLDWWARQNIRMDQKAKRFWNKHSKNPRQAQPMSTLPVSIQIGDHLLTHFHKETVYEELHAGPILAYWAKKDDIPPEALTVVNWRASKLALKEQPRGLRRWHAKWASRHCSVGRMMKLRKEWTHNRCPLCGIQEETTIHVLRCAKATTTWSLTMEKLKLWMEEQQTDPYLGKAIISHLQHWRDDTPHDNRNYRRTLRQALLQQQEVGWYSFILGRHSKDFQHIQQAYYHSIDSKRTGLRWTVAIIKKLMDVAWDMWQHRNAVLHDDPNNYHTKLLIEEADLAILQEFAEGSSNLLRGDRFLLRSRRTVLKGSIEDKTRWLASIAGARAAWEAKQKETPTYDPERRAMEAWLATAPRAQERRLEQCTVAR
jgi:hypothetical protein